MLRMLAVGFGAAAVAPLAACTRQSDATVSGSPSLSATSTPSVTPSPTVDPSAFWADQQITGTVDFANWPYYIDRTRTNGHPSLDLFTQQKGIQVAYTRPIRANAHFLDKIRSSLEAGTPEYDIIVITNGPELSELMASDWLTPLDLTLLPHFTEFASPLVRGPAWDPENRYTIAWQSGFTGLGFRPEAVEALGREPNSLQDLWDPRLKDRVGMMVDLLDLGSAGLLSTGVNPEVSTTQDWRRAADHLREQHAIVAPRYYDQVYIDALARGDTWLSLAWSGDVFQQQQLGFPELRWVMPDEGAMFFTDNMMIPRGAAHPADAIALMDFVYKPIVAAMIADWVWFISPVPAASDIIETQFDDPVVANSPLVFPDFSGGVSGGSEGLDAPVRNYYVFADPAEYEVWRSIFEPAIYASQA
jgi:spermidine/putrescine transport system substrate-binding protein